MKKHCLPNGRTKKENPQMEFVYKFDIVKARAFGAFDRKS